MKSDIFHAYDPTSVRGAIFGIRITRPSLAIGDPIPCQEPTNRILVAVSGRSSYLFSSLMATFPVKATHHAEEAGQQFKRIGHPMSLRTDSSGLPATSDQHAEKAVHQPTNGPKIPHSFGHSILLRLSAPLFGWRRQ